MQQGVAVKRPSNRSINPKDGIFSWYLAGNSSLKNKEVGRKSRQEFPKRKISSADCEDQLTV